MKFTNRFSKKIWMTTELLLILGILLLIWPSHAKYIVVYSLGALFLLQGLILLIDYVKNRRLPFSSASLITAFFLFVLGIFFIALPDVVLAFVMILLGLLLLFWALLDIAKGYAEVSAKRPVGWMNLVSGGILFVISICFFFVPGKSSDVLIRVLGSLLVIFGLMNLFSIVRDQKKGKDQKEEVNGSSPKIDENKAIIDAEIVKEDEKKDD